MFSDASSAKVSTETGIITQTDASGVALSLPNNSQLRQSRFLERNELAKLRQRQLLVDRTNPGFASQFCSLFLAVCCCISTEDDTIYRNSTFLAPQSPHMNGKKCLILDLDETLVHSSFKPVPNPDYIIPVNIDGTTHRVYVIKRPGVDDFLAKLGDLYEVVIFTASLSKYADPLLDMLDVGKVIQGRLFRESCTCYQGNYVKDLTLVGRDINSIIIVDNSPASYLFQPENAIGVSTFIDDHNDRELFYCLPFLQSIVTVPDVTQTLHTYPTFISQQVTKHLNENR